MMCSKAQSDPNGKKEKKINSCGGKTKTHSSDKCWKRVISPTYYGLIMSWDYRLSSSAMKLTSTKKLKTRIATKSKLKPKNTD